MLRGMRCIVNWVYLRDGFLPVFSYCLSGHRASMYVCLKFRSAAHQYCRLLGGRESTTYRGIEQVQSLDLQAIAKGLFVRFC